MAMHQGKELTTSHDESPEGGRDELEDGPTPSALSRDAPESVPLATSRRARDQAIQFESPFPTDSVKQDDRHSKVRIAQAVRRLTGRDDAERHGPPSDDVPSESLGSRHAVARDQGTPAASVRSRLGPVGALSEPFFDCGAPVVRSAHRALDVESSAATTPHDEKKQQAAQGALNLVEGRTDAPKAARIAADPTGWARLAQHPGAEMAQTNAAHRATMDEGAAPSTAPGTEARADGGRPLPDDDGKLVTPHQHAEQHAGVAARPTAGPHPSTSAPPTSAAQPGWPPWVPTPDPLDAGSLAAVSFPAPPALPRFDAPFDSALAPPDGSRLSSLGPVARQPSTPPGANRGMSAAYPALFGALGAVAASVILILTARHTAPVRVQELVVQHAAANAVVPAKTHVLQIPTVQIRSDSDAGEAQYAQAESPGSKVPFDAIATRDVMRTAELRASACSNSGRTARVRATFRQDGTISRVVVDPEDERDATALSCVQEAFLSLKTAPFEGEPVTLVREVRFRK